MTTLSIPVENVAATHTASPVTTTTSAPKTKVDNPVVSPVTAAKPKVTTTSPATVVSVTGSIGSQPAQTAPKPKVKTTSPVTGTTTNIHSIYR